MVKAQTFTEVPTSLPGLFLPSIEWGDYDNDADLDLLITGNGMAKVFRNDSTGGFTEIANLASVQYGDGTWGDFDNDGDLDILVTGHSPTRIFRNNGSDSFIDIGLNIFNNDSWSDVDWGDFDNDGDLDILLNGHHSYYDWLTRVYEYKNGQYILKYDLGYNHDADLRWGDYDNDGDLDILTSGVNSKIYQNNGIAGFSEIRNYGYYHDGSSSCWGDYDNDGDLDVLIIGYYGVILSRNDGNNLFTDISTGLPNVRHGYADWGDYDNDGDLDIILTGYKPGEVSEIISRIYRNDGNNVFTDINAGLTGVHYSCAKFADIDNDGNLDVMLSGNTGTSEITKLYRNDGLVSNTSPLTPSNLLETITDEYVQFSWDKASDNETPQEGLTYNLRIGMVSESGDDFSPASAADGFRQVVRMGNTNLNNTWKINNLQPGEHFWSVQTIDNAYKGSPFAAERSFIFTASSHYVPVSPDPFIFKAIKPSEVKMQKLQIINPLKNDILHITDITLANPAFSLGQTSFDIDPADTVDLVITFAPSAIGIYNDTIKFTISNPNIPVQKYNVTAYAANTLCGVLTTNTTWTKANSPYFIDCGNLGVDQGVRLTIEAGVTVVLDSMKRILVDGELVVNGTESEPVIFTNNGVSIFERLYFRANSKGQLSNFIIVNAQKGIFAENAIIITDRGKISNCNIGISLNGTKATINNTEIFDNTSYGIYAENSSIINLNSSTIRDNKTSGLYAYNYCNINATSSIFKNNSGDGFNFTNYSTAIINKSLIENNQRNGIGYSSSWEWATLTAKENIIRNNNGWAVFADGQSQTTIIENNIIQQNGSGLYFRNGTIKSNTITENRGIGIKALTVSNISYNKVYNNYSDGIEANENCNLNNNLIQSNKGNGVVDNGSSQILYNEIINNTLNGVLANNISTINYNSVINNRKYDIEVTRQTSETVNAENNWWGTTIADTIKNHIRDFYDDAASVKVDFNPYKGSPVTLEIIKGFVALKDEPGKLKLCWEENIKAKNYFLYFDNQTGTIDTSEVWVSLDSSETSYLASLPVGDYKFAIRVTGQGGGSSYLAFYDYTLTSIAELNPQEISFGSVRPSRYIDNQQTTFIKNTGDLPLHIDSISGIEPPFSITVALPAYIATGESIPVTVNLERDFTLNSYSINCWIHSNGNKLQSDTILPISAQIIGISAPSDFKASYFKDSLVISWNKVNENDLTGYKLYRNTEANTATAAVLVNLTNADTSYTDNTILSGQTYYYWVTSTDTANYESGFSDPIKTSDNSISTDGLLAWYPFNGNANDESGNINNGTVVGATLTDDRFGQPNRAYSFNGSAKIWSAIPKTPVGNSARTLSFWAKPYSGEGTIINMGTPEALGWWNIGLSGLSTYFWGSGYDFLIGGTMPVNTWTNVVVTYNQGEMITYINGVQANVFTDRNFNTVFGDFIIGCLGYHHDYTWNYFNGAVDDIALYNRPLTQEEVQSLFLCTDVYALDFGALENNASKTLPLKIFNTESSDIEYIIRTVSAPFETEQTSLNIQANGSGTINVSFHPTALGFFNDTLYIERNDQSKPLLVVPLSGSSVTQLCGVITRDTTLTKANSPYLVNCVFTIDKGASLTIEPGVTIQIDSMKRILVDGSLIANGTISEPIHFINRGSDRFDQIFFRSAEKGILSNVIIENAQKGIYAENTSIILSGGKISNCGQGIELNNSLVSIDSMEVFNNSNNGIYGYNIARGSIRHCTIRDNIENGISQGCFTIQQSTISNNMGWAIYTDNNSGFVIENNIVSGNGSGIHANNSITKNNQVTSNNGEGININVGTVENNTITQNKGIALNIWSVQASKNTITDNFNWGIRSDGSQISDNLIERNGTGGITGNGLTITLNKINSNTGNGLYLSGSTIRANMIAYNSLNGIECTGNNTIENNLIINNLQNGIIEGSNCTITKNDIENNGKNGIETSSLPLVNFNNITGNIGYALKTTMQSNEIVNAENNYWGVTTESSIGVKVYDYYDNGVSVKVDYIPFKSEVNNIESITGFTALKGFPGTIGLSWNSDAKASRYELFYDNQTGIIDSTTIWVTLDSSKTSYLATLAKGDYIFAIRSVAQNGGTSRLVSLKFIQPAEIAWHYPVNNSLNVPADTVIKIRFTEPMNAVSINNNTFSVLARQTGLHSGTFIYNASDSSVIFTPLKPFVAGESVSVTLTEDIQMSSSAKISSPYSFSFTIRSQYGTGIFMSDIVPLSAPPNDIFSGDYDGDGDIDMIISASGDLLKNDGNGKFIQFSKPFVNSKFIATGDIDLDGDIDVVESCQMDVKVFKNNGTGEFTSTQNITVSEDPQSISLADFDNDGFLDFVVARRGTSILSIYHNNGTGNFTVLQSLFIGGYQVFSSTGDWDNDGDIDIACADDGYPSKVYILKNDGTGLFSLFQNLDVCAYSMYLINGNIDGDKDLDLLLSQLYCGVTALKNDKNANFTVANTFGTGDYLHPFKLGDLDADGDLDGIEANFSTHKITIHNNDGAGNYTQSSVIPVGTNPSGLDIADFDGDGDLDIAVANANSQNISILYNRNIDASISLSSDSLDFNLVNIGNTKSMPLTIYNNGVDSTLKILNISTSGSALITDKTSLSILADNSSVISVTFQPQSLGYFNDTLIITSNDPYKPLFKIPLSGVYVNTLCGIISVDTTLTKANSPYFVNCAFSIDKGKSLTIEAGVTILVDSMRKILIDGRLFANGTAQEPVRFMSDGNDRFDQIFFRQGRESNLSHVIIEGAQKGIYAENTSLVLSGGKISNCGQGIELNNCLVSIDSIEIINNNNNGIYGYNGARGNISHCTISNNMENGIWQGSFTMLQNTISHNLGWGIYTDNNSGFILENNTVSGNGSGIHANNSITKNNQVTSNNGEGISISGGTVENNTITQNKGIALNIWSVQASKNTITDNFNWGIRSDGSQISDNVVERNVSGGITGNELIIISNQINSNGGDGLYLSNSIIRSNMIANNNLHGIECTGTNTIDNNRIINNLQNGIIEGSNCTITKNDIENNGINGIETSSLPIVNFNNITGNIDYALKANKQSNEVVNAESNYWGVSTSSGIEEKVYDYYDNGVSVKVDFLPYKSTPNTLEKVMDFIAMKGISGTIELSWSTNIKASRYELFYDEQEGVFDTTIIWVTVDSSKTNYSATLPKGNYIFAIRAATQSGRESQLVYYNYTLSSIAEFNPGFIDFGSVRPSQYTDNQQTAYIKNIGDLPLHIDSISGIQPPFSIIASLPADIEIGESLPLIVILERNFALNSYNSIARLHSDGNKIQSDSSLVLTALIKGISTPTNFNATYFKDSLKLIWNSIHEDDLTGYKLYRNTEAITATASVLINLAKTDTFYTDNSIEPGQTYYYWVTSQDTANFESEFSPMLQTISLPEIPINGLIAYYPFNGNAIDESYSGHDGTAVGPVLISDRFGKPNSAYQFDGVNDYIATNFNLAGLSTFSISVWVQPFGFGPSSDGDRIISQYNDCYGENVRLVLSHDRKFLVSIINEYPYNSSEIYSQSNSVDFADWYNVVYTYDGNLSNSNLKLYINGLLVNESDLKGFPYPWCTNYNIVIGGNSPDLTTRNFNGIIDDIAIYNRALSKEEVSAVNGQLIFPVTLNFGAVAKDSNKTLQLNINSNESTDVSYTIHNLNPPFATGQNSLNIQAEESGTLNVMFNPASLGYYNDTLYIERTDHSKPVIKVPVSGSSVTQLCGVISEDTTLTKAHSPYFINCVFTIDKDKTLTIEPGVIILIDSMRKILVDGSLIANGTAEEPIRFINEGSDNFDQVFFRHSGPSELSNVIIEGAQKGIYGENTSLKISGGEINNCGQGIELNNCSADISGILIQNNRNNGINSFNGTMGSITNSTIQDNNESGVFQGSFTMTGNTITDNRGWGIYIDENQGKTISNCTVNNNGSGIHASNSIIHGNIVTSNNDQGINATGATISENIITSNKGVGINAWNSRVQDNTINNNLGWGTQAWSSTLTNNKVTYNSSGGISGESLTFLYNFINHNAGNGLSVSASTIKQNEIMHNTGIGISTTGYNLIENNKIAYNRGDGINEGSNCTIKFNDIYGNEGDGIETATLPVINFNNIIGNKAFDLKATKQSNETVNAESNYWGSTLAANIKLRVYDYYDDGVTVKVDYDPYKNEPLTLNGVQGFTAKKISNGIIELNWTPVMKSSGYQLFYDNQSGIVDSVNVWVSLDSSKTSYQASLTKGDYKFAISAVGPYGNKSKLSFTEFKLSPILDLTPVLVDFGTLRPSKYNLPLFSVWIKNLGDKSLKIDSLAAIKYPFSYSFETPDTIPDSDSLRIDITLNRNVAQGSYKDNLNIFCNASNKVNLLNDGLVAYYPFNGNAEDVSGNGRNGNVIGPVLTADRFGNSNSAYSFDGIDDYIKTFANNLPSGERTVSLWFNANSVDNQPVLLGYGGNYNNCNSYLQGINICQRGKFQVQSHCDANSLEKTYNQIPVNEWHHWLITTNQAGTVMYLDGAEVARNNIFINNTFTADRDLSIGCGVGSGYYTYGYAPYSDNCMGYFNGSLDEIRIYNRCVSESEIQALYHSDASSIALKAKFDYIDPPLNFKANYYKDSIQFTWNASIEADLEAYRIYRNNSDDTTGIKLLTEPGKYMRAFTDNSLIPGQYYSYWITSVDTSGFESSLSNSVKTMGAGLPTDGLLAWYPFNNNANDESGNNNNCAVSAATLSADRFGVANNAYSFTGSSKIFSSIGNVPIGNTPRSICFWTKPTSDGGTIINMGTGECTAKMFTIQRSGSTAHFWGGCYDFSLGFTIPNNEWTYVVVSYDGGKMIIYKNGIQVNLIENILLSTSFSDFIIGASGWNANDTWNYFNGFIDDVALYNRSLTPEEVTLLYQGTQNQKVNFSVVEANSSLTKSFILSNTANIPKSFTLYSPSAPYSLGQSSVTVDASGNVPINVTFNPTLLGVYRDTIIIEADSHDEPIRIIALSGLSVTPVCGVYSEDFTLTKEFSPYYINCNMGVDSGATLTIDPGVMIILDSMRQVTIDGRLVANGTDAEPILFTNAAFDPFGNIFFRNGTGEFSWFRIENADKGIWGDVSEVTLSNGTISNCRNGVEMNGGKLKIDSMTFLENRENAVFANNNVTGSITNSLFTGNYYGVNSSGGNFTFENNILTENKSWAVTLSSNSNKPVRNNIVRNNGAGMSVNTANIIENNIIEDNKGEGINAWNSYVSENSVVRNSGRGMYASNCSVRDNIIGYNFGSGIHSDGGSVVERNSIRFNTGDGITGEGITLNSNLIENNGGIGISLYNSKISGNKVVKNGSIGILSDNNTIISNVISFNGNDGIRENGNSQIRYNDILDNLDDGIEAANLPVINFNNIYNNKKFNVKALRKSYETIDAKENFWGTTLTSKIASKIWDYYDDGATVKVSYSNWSDEAILMRPVDNFRAYCLEAGKIELVWNSHPKAYQYYLYYASSDSQIDTTIAWVVLDSTKINYQATLPDGEYIFGIKPVNYALDQGIMSTTLGISDGTPPTLLSAYGETQDSTLLVTFSEEIDYYSAMDSNKWILNNGLSVKKVLKAEKRDLVAGINCAWRLYYFENNGNSNTPDFTLNSDAFANVYLGMPTPSFADIDGDGDFDMMVGGDSPEQLYLYTNTGNVKNPVWELNPYNFTGLTGYYNAPALTDIDGDQDFDLLNMNNWWGNSSLSVNTGNKNIPFWVKESFPEYGYSRPAFIDIDNDNDEDLFIGTNGSLVFYRNDGNPFEPKWTFVTDSYLAVNGNWIAPEFYDFDNDGDYDLFIGKEDGYISYFKNKGTPELANFELITSQFANINYGCHIRPSFVDIDGDGSKQAVILQLDGPLPGIGSEISLSNSGIADNTGNLAGSQNISFFTDDGNKNPSATLGSIPGLVSKDVAVNYIISDEEKDIVRLKPMYSADGGINWKTATITGDTLNLDSTRYSGSLVWHSYTDIPGVVLKNVRFRLTPRDGDIRYDGTPGISNKLIVNNNIRPVITIPLIVGEVKEDVTISYSLNDNEADLCRIYAEYYNPVLKVWLGATINGDTTNIANGVHTIIWKAGIDLAGTAKVTPFRITPFDAAKGQSDTVDLVVDNIGISSVQITNMLPVETGGEILFNYLVSDDELDEIDLKAQYSTNNGLTWKTASVLDDIDSIAFADYTGSFTWNTNTDFNGTDVPEVLFRLTPNDGNDGIPAEWTFHIDNNGIPSVSVTDIPGLKRGNIKINYSLTDPEGNNLGISIRYLNNSAWNPCTLEGQLSGILPANYSGSLIWNSMADIPDADGIYTLIVIPADNDEGIVDTLEIEVNNMSIINIGGNAAICQGQSKQYDAGWEYQSFLWSTGETSQTVELNANGSFWVKAVDFNNKTHYSDTITISVHPLPQPNLGIDLFMCQGQQETLFPGSFNAYNWNTGFTGSALTVNTTGYYTVEVTDEYGCQNMDTAYVFVQSPYENEEICFATANKQFNNNTIVWKKTPGKGTTVFKIYRESTSGGYELIGLQEYEAAGIFTDTMSFSDQLKYNYKISLVDSCGHESGLSPSHGTIWLKVNKGSAGFDLTWTAYEGMDLDKYEIYRGSDSMNMIKVKDIAGSITSWSDNFVPQCVVYYQVKAAVPLSCMDAGNPDYQEIESNIAGNGAVRPRPIIMGPVSFCDGESTMLDAGNFNSYLWSNGKTTQTIEISAGGTFTVNVSNEFGCYATSDSFIITVTPSPRFNLGNDTTVCGSQLMTITGPAGFQSYFWENGSSQISRSVSATGLYKLIVTDENGCKGMDEILVTYQNLPNPELNTVEYICPGGQTSLDPGQFVSYLWNTGATTRVLTANTDGTYLVTVTDVHGCQNTDEVVVYNYTDPDINLGPDVVICQDTSYQFDAGNFNLYQWSNGRNTQTITTNVQGNYWVRVNDSHNCIWQSDTVYLAINALPQFDLGTDTSICGAQQFTIHGPTGYLSYSWDNGSIQKDRTVSTTGLFRLFARDINGCKNSDEILISYQNLPVINLNPIEYICGDEPAYLDPGEFASYQWSNGSTNRIYMVSTSQTIEVTVTDVNLCSATKQVLVESRSSSNLDLGTDITICQNDSAELKAGTSYVSYLWSTGETTGTIRVKAQGNYILQVTDVFKCKSTDTITVSVIPAPAAPDPGPERTICYGDEIILDAGPDYASYLWNNDMTTRTITVDTSGIYTVTGFGENGCSAKEYVKVNATIPYSGQEICMVTVDESNKNMVIWEKPGLSSIDKYFIYRESSFAGIYEIIGIQSASQLTVFTDPASNPEEKSDRYRISVVDTCGNESPMSPPHKTMHLTINKGLNEELNLIWENYEGMLFGTYEIYRGPAVDSLELIKTIQSSITSFTDNNVPEGLVYYQIAIINPDTCDPAGLLGKKASSGPFVHSLSNLEDNRLQGTGIGNIFADALKLTVYPSPFTDITSIHYTLENPTLMKMEIYNVVGGKILTLLDEIQSAGIHKIELKSADLNNIPGVYYLKIMVDETAIIRKIILTR